MACTKYEHLMLPGAFLDKVTQDFDFKVKQEETWGEWHSRLRCCTENCKFLGQTSLFRYLTLL